MRYLFDGILLQGLLILSVLRYNLNPPMYYGPVLSRHDVPNCRGTSLRASLKSLTHISSDHLTPEIKLHLITSASPLWKVAPEESLFKDPFWGFYWPGGQGLTRYILDNKNLFENKYVVDVGSGCGACAIAAARSGAKSVIANDIDPVACEVISMNCRENSVKVHLLSKNLISEELPFCADVIVVGDMFYDTEFGDILFNWLLSNRQRNRRVYLGDPGRHALDKRKMEKLRCLQEYSLLPHSILENNGFVQSYIWEIK